MKPKVTKLTDGPEPERLSAKPGGAEFYTPIKSGRTPITPQSAAGCTRHHPLPAGSPGDKPCKQ